ncbi:hypothetical protein [Nonomuraea sp. NPDC049480]|uniref:hypothetical protein n=1 Tax=Nonomuraea sp. NPDC049480 TaxID=3364353 RepID=UPI0037A9450C
MDPHDTPKQPGPDDATLPENTNPNGLSPNPRQQSSGTGQAGNLLALVNGAIVAVGGVFVTTSSVVITVIASVVALLIALMIVLRN